MSLPLHVTSVNAGGGGDMRVVASGTKVGVAAVDEVTRREATTLVDLDGVHVSPCVLALDTDQSCVM
jgi:hypothetical protein